MNEEKAIVIRGADALTGDDRFRHVMEVFFARQSKYTVDGYRQDLLCFCRFLGLLKTDATMKEAQDSALEELTKWICTIPVGTANYQTILFTQNMRDKEKNAPATINRRLAAIRSLVKLTRMLGLTVWALDAPGVRAQRSRDTAGPSLEQVQTIFRSFKDNGSEQSVRDEAILLLLFVRGLRSVEVRELDLEHVDLTKKRIFIRGKGKTERQPQTIPAPVCASLKKWIELRGSRPGALFVGLNKQSDRTKRISRVGLWRVVRNVGQAVGLHVWPHGLRHAAITQGLDLSSGDVRSVRSFSRHERVQTVMDYDDARKDVGGKISEKLSELLEKTTDAGVEAIMESLKRKDMSVYRT